MQRQRLILATENAHKVAEITAMLVGFDVDVETLAEHPDVTPDEETGDTFLANAIIKAESIAAATGGWSLADDSGLEVDALDKRPGVYSKRYAGPEATAADNNRKLLHELGDVPDPERRARFVTVMALARPGEDTIHVRGEVEGYILHEARGEGGFGYDPLFYYPPYERAFGELEAEQKNRVSHRAAALAAMRTKLLPLLVDPSSPAANETATGANDTTPPAASPTGPWPGEHAVAPPPPGFLSPEQRDDGPAAPRGHLGFLEYVEAIVLALILALILREFFVEAFQIPTPSMAPTLRGEPYGDKILVDKLVYRFRDPRRWEVMVFRYPLDHTTNFIKRVIGLPGERVQLDDGDVWIDGKIEQKPIVTQRGLWIPLFPECRDPYTASRFGARGESAEYGLPGHFEVEEYRAGGAATRPSAQPNDRADARLNEATRKDEAGNGAAAKEEPVEITSDAYRADATASKSIRLRYAFLENGERRFHPPPAFSYRDVRFHGQVTLETETSVATVALDTRDHRFRATFSAGKSGAQLTRLEPSRRGAALQTPLSATTTGSGRRLPVGQPVDIEVMFFDHRFVVEVDGEIWFDLVFEGRFVTHVLDTPLTALSLESSGGPVAWKELGVDRDLFYLGPHIAEVPEASYFVLGDNSNNSKDSRRWRRVRYKLKDGRTIDCDSEQQSTLGFHGAFGRQTYKDIYGDEHAGSEIDFSVTPETDAAPFVGRELIIGRAFVIIFPWPPFYNGDFRPGIIR